VFNYLETYDLIVSGRSKSQRPNAGIRRDASRQQAKSILAAIISGETEAYEEYRALFRIYCSNSAALEVIKPLFRMPGIDPDGVFSATDDFRARVIVLAQELLPLISEQPSRRT